MRLAEVAPAAPIVIEALPIFLALCACIGALFFVRFAKAIVEGIFWPFKHLVGGIPYVGSKLSYPFRKVEQKLINVLASAELKVDSYIGWCWHNLALLARRVAAEIEALGHDVGLVMRFLAQHPSWAELRHFADALVHPLRTFQHLERRLIRFYRAEVARIEHTVGAAVLPRIHAGEAALDRVIEWDIPRLRARTRAVEHRLDRLWKWVRAHEKIVVTAAFTAAVAVALSRLGGRWIRCKNWRRIGNHVCGLPTSLIEDLLGLALAFLVVIDPVDIAKAAIETEDLMHDLIVKIAELNPEADGITRDALDGLAASL